MERKFPLQRRGKKESNEPQHIPWSVAEKAYKEYQRRYGSDQSLERIAQRGGFGIAEMDKFYPQWRQEINEGCLTMNRTRLQELAGIKPNTTICEAAPALNIGDHVTIKKPRKHEPNKIGQITKQRDDRYVVMWDLHNSDIYDPAQLQQAEQSEKFSLGDSVVKGEQFQKVGRIFSYHGGPYFEVQWNEGTYSTEHENDIKES